MAIDPDDAPSPALAERFSLAVAMASRVTIGTLATGGTREYQAVQGGAFHGAGISGDVIAGGETLLHRPDGVGVLEANFIVRTADGDAIRIIGTGYRTWDAPFVGTRMTIVFEAGEGGTHAHLATRAWLAERPADGDRYAISEIL